MLEIKKMSFVTEEQLSIAREIIAYRINQPDRKWKMMLKFYMRYHPKGYLNNNLINILRDKYDFNLILKKISSKTKMHNIAIVLKQHNIEAEASC
jgi:hypothetical protein